MPVKKVANRIGGRLKVRKPAGKPLAPARFNPNPKPRAARKRTASRVVNIGKPKRAIR